MYKGEAPDGDAVAVKVMALSSETAEEVRGIYIYVCVCAYVYVGRGIRCAGSWFLCEHV